MWWAETCLHVVRLRLRFPIASPPLATLSVVTGTSTRMLVAGSSRSRILVILVSIPSSCISSAASLPSRCSVSNCDNALATAPFLFHANMLMFGSTSNAVFKVVLTSCWKTSPLAACNFDWNDVRASLNPTPLCLEQCALSASDSSTHYVMTSLIPCVLPM